MPTPRPIPDWDTLLAELQAWVRAEGTTSTIRQASLGVRPGSSYRLGSRLRAVRQRYERGTLDPSYVEQLEALPGWEWHKDHWGEQYAKVRNFHDEHGTLRGLPGHSKYLHNWLIRQRAAVRDERLDPAKRQALEQIPGALATRSELTLREFVDALRQWQHDTGRSIEQLTVKDVGRNPRTGEPIPLLKRVLYYRARYRGEEGTHPLAFNDDHVKLLESVPGWRW